MHKKVNRRALLFKVNSLTEQKNLVQSLYKASQGWR